MDSPRKLIVGYDLCEDFTQISCYSYKTMEPIPISVQEEDANPLIPTVLCFRTETKQWLFGEDAIHCAASGGGTLVNHLLGNLQSDSEIDIYGQKFTGVALLEKYFVKTLTLVKNYFPTEHITKLVVTIRNTDTKLVDKIYETLSFLGLERDRAVVMNHAGVYMYYALSQEKSLWTNDVGLFDFTKEGLSYYQIKINRRTTPMVAGLLKKDYSDSLDLSMLKQKDNDPGYVFENIANNALYKQIISTLYITGPGFEGNWAKEVIQNLCKGRRAFVGQNLYTKGACFAAKELSGDRGLEDFILLNDDMITSYVTVRVYADAAFQEIPLTQPGQNWYDVNKNIEVIPEGDAALEIEQKSIMTREVNRQTLPIIQFPDREDKVTRLLINLTCKDRTTGVIQITDLGFGDIYPETGQSEEYTFNI